MTTFPVLPNHAERVLVASPSHVLRQQVLERLQARARRIEQASGGAEALVHLESGSWQVLLLDRRLPDLDAEELSHTVRRRYPSVEVVLLDGESDGGDGTETPDAPCEREITWQGRATEAGARLGEAECEAALPGMIGDSVAMQSVYRMTRLVARRDTTVLITGPTGSGKELVARAVHELSGRAGRAFAVVNCAAIPETLLEAELFGYSRGAFTGALQSYAGRIQAAHQGTLFLDEIGDMPLSLQPKLLRFLEQKELQRLGSAQVVRVDARVVAATNVDLLGLAGQGRFREDLYYRLAAFPLAIPPLGERPGDIRQLAGHLVEKLAGGPEAPALSEEACTLLEGHNWPGNVRELQNVVERALILAAGERVIRPWHVMQADASFRNRGAAR